PLNDERLEEQKKAKKIVEQLWADIAAIQKTNNTAQLDLKKYLGIYKDVWFGEVVISEVNGKMHFQAKNSPKLKGDITYYKGNTFVVRWYDRSLDADAFINFTL